MTTAAAMTAALTCRFMKIYHQSLLVGPMIIGESAAVPPASAL
jgi:hypothetical protein